MNQTMKTISARTNPAFKRTQLLPVILNLVPPATDTAVRPFGFLLPEPANDRLIRVAPQPRPAHADLRPLTSDHRLCPLPSAPLPTDH
jgi:hypothetical protein